MNFQNLIEKGMEWVPPRVVAGNPFSLTCTFTPPATDEEITRAWEGLKLPADLVAMWKSFGAACLFQDVDYGQWGMRVLSPAESFARTIEQRESRPNAFAADEIVVAEFFGDQDLVVRDVNALAADRGVLVALPLDPKEEWYGVGPNMLDFLANYFAKDGAKYWETTN